MKKYIWVIILLIILIWFFFPKSYVKGGLFGEIGPGASRYKEEYGCFGIKHSYYPTNCQDCPGVYNCYGITYGKKCYMEKYIERDISKEATECK